MSDDLLRLVADLDGGASVDLPDPRRVELAVAALDGCDDPLVHAEALHHLAYLGMRADRSRFRHLVDELARVDASLVRDVEARAHGLLAHAGAAALDGDLDRAARLSVNAHALALREGARDLTVLRTGINVGVFGGDLTEHREEALEVLDAVAARAAGPLAPLAPVLHAVRANAVWAAGDLDAAAEGYEEAREAALAVDLPRWVAEAECGLTHISADRGDVVAARRHLAACVEAGDRWRADARTGQGMGGPGRQWVSTTALRARIAFAEGNDAAAVAAWLAEVVDPGAPGIARAVSAMDLTVAALATGDDRALASAAEELRAAPARGLPLSLVKPLVLAAAEDDLAAAERAAATARAGPVYAIGRAGDTVGLLARRLGQPDVAATWFRTSHTAWTNSRADALAGRTAAWLRSVGVHIRGSSDDRPSMGWASITPAEARVIEQVATGALYREIAERLHLSRRTVETHVASVLRKLDLRTRGELAAAWYRDGPGQDP